MTPATEKSICVDVHTAARMIGVSVWSVREYIAAGELATIKLPATKGPEMRSRRVLIAVTDLEAFVARCRS